METFHRTSLLAMMESKLQLGHGFFSVETRNSALIAHIAGRASIGPRIFLRGNKIAPTTINASGGCFNWATDFSPWKQIRWSADRARIQSASIGPRIFLRGNALRLERPELAHHVLQLGHGFFSVETQWNLFTRNFFSSASIGPRIFLRGNQPLMIMFTTAGVASIGPRIFLRGNQRLSARFAEHENASIGPRIFLRGNSRRDRPR